MLNRDIKKSTTNTFKLLTVKGCNANRVEVTRKIVHLITLAIPIGYTWCQRRLFYYCHSSLLGFLSVDFCVTIILEWPPFSKIFFSERSSGEEEKTDPDGVNLLSLFYPPRHPPLPKTNRHSHLLILSISDTAAALWEKGLEIRIFKKTLEDQSLLHHFSLDRLDLPGLDRLSGSLAALGATVIEILPIQLDDNLTIPLLQERLCFWVVISEGILSSVSTMILSSFSEEISAIAE